MRRLFCTILLIVPLFTAISQPLPTLRFGLSGEGGLNFHTSSFAGIPGFPQSPVPFDGGRGVGFCFGGMVDYPLGDAVRIGLFAGYDRRGATLTGDESTVFTVNGTPVAGTIRHSLTAPLGSIVLRPTFTLITGNVEIGFGLSLSRILDADFGQKQEVIEPQGISLTTTPVNGALSGYTATAAAPSLSLGIRYPTGNITVIPHIRGEAGLADIAGLSWRAWSVRGGISVVFEQRSAPPDTSPPAPPPPQPVLQFDTLYVRDTVTIEMQGIAAPTLTLFSRSFSSDTVFRRITLRETYRREIPRPTPLLKAQAGVAFVRADGSQSAKLQLEIRRTITKRFFPILPALFFGNNATEIPARYNNPPAESPLARYYLLLDTIARRMAAMPQAALTLTAVLAGDSLDAKSPDATPRREGFSGAPTSTLPAGEEARLFRAARQKRAENIKKALLLRAAITPDNIQIRSSFLPAPTDAALREEAERVDITATDPALLAPMIFYDTTEHSDPPVVRFLPNVISDGGVESWRMTVSADGAIVKEFSGANEPPASIDWQVGSEKSLLRTRKPLVFRLTAVNFAGDTTVSPDGEIRFAADAVSAENVGEMFDALEYSIVFFDYNSSAIAARDRATLAVLKRFCTAARTDITGMTDALGDEQYNRALSQKRAEAVARILEVKRSAAHGNGSAGAEFPNDLPEGRMFNRRVRISIIR